MGVITNCQQGINMGMITGFLGTTGSSLASTRIDFLGTDLVAAATVTGAPPGGARPPWEGVAGGIIGGQGGVHQVACMVELGRS